jgi:ribosomal protein S18 acetylase RimI-like enzyme
MIRPAELEDFDSIIRIRKASALDMAKLKNTGYRVQVQRSGFLLPIELTFEDFEKNLSNYSVYLDNGRVSGYVRVDTGHDIKPKTKVFWLKEELRQVYFSEPHSYIYGIGVLPETRHKGIATKMMQSVETKTRALGITYLFSLAVLSPVTNFPSMMLHEKNGFERLVVVLEPISVNDPADYQALMYGKKLI